MLQSKSRAESSGEADRERGWLDKNIARALRQAAGSVRALRSRSRTMSNRRGNSVEVHGDEIDWLTVVLIDHDEVPAGYTPDSGEERAVVLTRGDWEFLFDHLRSATWVLDYLDRVVGEPFELGREPVRYYEIAASDDLADAGDLPAWGANGRTHAWAGRAPLEPAGHAETEAHFLLRSVQEDIGRTEIGRERELERLEVLRHLDGIPVGLRVEVGRRVLEFVDATRKWRRATLATRTRVILPGSARSAGVDGPLMFMAASELTPTSEAVFRTRAELLHHDFGLESGWEGYRTTGVLLTPSSDHQKAWTTSMVTAQGNLDLDPSYVTELRRYHDVTRVDVL
ncbi:hypothetical protein SAMN04489720_3127 [Agrococcus jejuensis]|uniref:Uncharacterized protein n=2 Tax=Agrococcus jejuensis TaxID=399736 RepID=A0A1G8GYC1_9MICO|nr:hypothetical protein SAMN04489720_3127 [Agrococcus jejuensis]